LSSLSLREKDGRVEFKMAQANTGRHEKDRTIIVSHNHHGRGHRRCRCSSSISISIEKLSQEGFVIYVIDLNFA